IPPRPSPASVSICGNSNSPPRPPRMAVTSAPSTGSAPRRRGTSAGSTARPISSIRAARSSPRRARTRTSCWSPTWTGTWCARCAICGSSSATAGPRPTGRWRRFDGAGMSVAAIGAGGDLEIGSDAHLRLFCDTLLDTHNPYKPAVLDWPKLDDAARDRIVSLPIWDMAVQTEGRASVKVMAYRDCVDDPLLKRAIEMDGFEEARHKRVLHNLVEAYGIKLAPEPPYPAPRDGEWAFMTIGYSECIDSFFAFGLFALAKNSGYFPPELVETFEPVMQEEARHILFFRNWVAWHRARLPLWRKIIFDARRVAVFARLIWQRA